MLATSQDACLGVSPDAMSLCVLTAVGLKGDDLAISLLEQSDDCIKLLSVEGHLEFMNCGGLGAMEIDQAERVLGKLWWDLWPLESRGYVREQFSKALNGKPVTFEASCPTFKGNPRNWSVSLKPMVARAGPVVSVLATSREI
tara:strand:- start:133 stop:561 length:429 start_codon:yes stop_codon:yes gene_type:complete